MKQQKTVSQFYERIVEQAKLRGQSLNCVERDLGFPRNALNNYKHVQSPSAKRLLELAQYFGVTPEYLVGESFPARFPSLPSGPIRYFNQLTDQEKHQIFILSQTWVLDMLQKVLSKSMEEKQ